MSEASAITGEDAGAELTIAQAAEALSVSRPFLLGLLDAGTIKSRALCDERRVSTASLLRYRDEDDARRAAVADALAAETYEL